MFYGERELFVQEVCLAKFGQNWWSFGIELSILLGLQEESFFETFTGITKFFYFGAVTFHYSLSVGVNILIMNLVYLHFVFSKAKIYSKNDIGVHKKSAAKQRLETLLENPSQFMEFLGI